MAQPKPNPFAWFVQGPLGPWGRKLGFRWVFPVGTMPVPYHPAIPFLFLAAPWLWLAASLFTSFTSPTAGGEQWRWMLLAGAFLGIPLSIPIMSWAFRAYGAILAQGLLFLGAMIALTADIATGREALAWALLPAGYLLTFVVQRIWGLWQVRRYRRLIAEFEPVTVGNRTVLTRALYFAVGAIKSGLLERAYIESTAGGSGQIVELIDQGEVAALENLKGKQLPWGWRVESGGRAPVLIRPGEPPRGPTLALEIERFGRRMGNNANTVRWRLGEGDYRREVVTGTARIVGPLPLAVLFYWISIGDGRAAWIAGFMPRDVRLTEKYGEDPTLVFAPPAEPPQRDNAQREALLAEAKAYWDSPEARERAERTALHRELRRREASGQRYGAGAVDPALFWREVATDPSCWSAHRQTYLTIAANAAECDREDLRRALNWLEAAIQVRARDAIVAAAKLLAAMDQPLLASDYARIKGLLNSRIVGMVWRITPDFDVKPLPPKVPKFGDEAGYGLIRSVPELYLKLADLGPEMEDMIVLLVEEALRYDVSLPPELAAMARPQAATG